MQVLLAIVSLLTIIDVVVGVSREAASSLFMKNECREIAIQWETIWVTPSLEGAEHRLDYLERRLESVTSSDPVVFSKLNNKFGEEAKNVIKKRFATQKQSA